MNVLPKEYRALSMIQSIYPLQSTSIPNYRKTPPTPDPYETLALPTLALSSRLLRLIRGVTHYAARLFTGHLRNCFANPVKSIGCSRDPKVQFFRELRWAIIESLTSDLNPLYVSRRVGIVAHYRSSTSFMAVVRTVRSSTSERSHVFVANAAF